MLAAITAAFTAFPVFVETIKELVKLIGDAVEQMRVSNRLKAMSVAADQASEGKDTSEIEKILAGGK